MPRRNATRKHVVKQLAPGVVTGIKPPTGKGPFDGDLHYHGCAVCSHLYEDCCTESGLDSICKDCMPHHFGRPSWERDRDPQPCCHHDSRPALPREIRSYRLAGLSTWWICDTCCRTHPYNPIIRRSS